MTSSSSEVDESSSLLTTDTDHTIVCIKIILYSVVN